MWLGWAADYAADFELERDEMAKLSMSDRAALPKTDFAVPSKAPGSGSYPVEDKAHAQNALSKASRFGTPTVKAAVKAKVMKKYPSMSRKTSTPRKQV